MGCGGFRHDAAGCGDRAHLRHAHAEQTLHLVRDAGARVIFVSTADELRKVVDIKDRCSIEKIAVMDDVNARTVSCRWNP